VPSIELYLDMPDLSLLQEFLNNEGDLAFIIPSSDGTFEMKDSVTLEPNHKYTLWHVPSGDVPVDCCDVQGRIVVDPIRGVRPGAIDLRLEVSPGKYQQLVRRSQGDGYELKLFDDPTAIGRSHFGWLGNKFKLVGKGALPSTVRWWQRLRRWVSKHGHRVTWTGELEGPKSELRVWAFPFAYAALKLGRPRSVNPVLWGESRGRLFAKQ
jgi:hypothetical protein